MQETVTQDREKYIGGSDEAAIMGLSPFVTRFELLKYKAGIEENTFTGNRYTEFGNVIEPAIRAYVNDKWGMNFVESKKILHDSDELPTRYHADGDDKAQETLLEIKSTSKIARAFDAVDQGIDFFEYACKYYKKYLVQLVKGMYAYGYKWGMLAVYERPEDWSTEFDPSRLQVFEISMESQEPLLKEILHADELFRTDFRAISENPWLEESDLPSMFSIDKVATNNQIIGDKEVSAAWLLRYEKEITTAIKDIKGQLKEQMEAHNVKTVEFSDLRLKVTLVDEGQDKIVSKFDEAKFKKENPRMYETYLKDSIQKGKTGYVRVTPMAEREKA